MERETERRRSGSGGGSGTGSGRWSGGRSGGRSGRRARPGAAATRRGARGPGWGILGLAALATCLGLAAPARATEPAAEPARVLGDVRFVGSSAELDSEAQARLAEHAAWLRDHPDVRVRIVGHTDPVSSVAANQSLGAQRAEVVRHELVSLGVSAERLRTASAGAQHPRCMESSLFCETLWKPGSTQQVASETACPQAPDDCFAAERRATFWVVAP